MGTAGLKPDEADRVRHQMRLFERGQPYRLG